MWPQVCMPMSEFIFAHNIISHRLWGDMLSLHLLHPEETCTRIDQSQGKIRACCYKWGWKEQAMTALCVCHIKCSPCPSYGFFSLGLSPNLDQLCSLSLSLSFSPSLLRSHFPSPYLPNFLSEFPCGCNIVTFPWCSNIDLKLLLWVVPPRKPTTPQRQAGAHALGLNFWVYISSLGRRGEFRRVPWYCFFE